MEAEMTTLNSAQLQADQFKDFWNRMAEHYPLPFDEKVLADTDRVIALARKRGVKIAGRTVLDIGCGTGIYALPLAREAAAVTGLDDSRQMITRFKGEIDNAGLRNVQVVKASWKDIDFFETSWEWHGPVEEALEDMVCFIEMQGVPAQRDKIEAVLARTARQGMISHATRVEEGIIVWSVE
jgi:SAM-dependent methyltransferase